MPDSLFTAARVLAGDAVPSAHDAASRRSMRGFTLLELLIVISIIAIASAGVSFAIRDSAEAALEREGDRLAALLEAGRALSRSSGQPVRWREAPDGFIFDGLSASSLPRNWLNAQSSVVWGTGQDHFVILGPEPIIDPQTITLLQDGRTVLVATDGLHPFAVRAAP